MIMFCTSKEQQTCDVEKRGCEGCYYNKDLGMDYCTLCANKKECFDNHWCVTMDRQRKINNKYICDNFELSGRKYEQEKEKVTEYEKQLDLDYVKNNYIERKVYEEQQKVIDMMAEEIVLSEAECGLGRDSEDVKQYYFEWARGE